MLQAASVQPNNYSLRVRRKSESHSFADEFHMSDEYDDDADGGDVKGRNKSRRELPSGAVATLKAWLLSPEHFTHPYPTPQDQAMLMEKTGIDKKQLKNWFTNARRRIWKPMLKKQIEQGKLTTAPGMPGAVPGLMLPNMTGAPGMNGSMDNPHSVQAMRAHYQQAVQQQQQSQEEAAAQQQVRGFRYMLHRVCYSGIAHTLYLSFSNCKLRTHSTIQHFIVPHRPRGRAFMGLLRIPIRHHRCSKVAPLVHSRLCLRVPN